MGEEWTELMDRSEIMDFGGLREEKAAFVPKDLLTFLAPFDCSPILCPC